MQFLSHLSPLKPKTHLSNILKFSSFLRKHYKDYLVNGVKGIICLFRETNKPKNALWANAEVLNIKAKYILASTVR